MKLINLLDAVAKAVECIIIFSKGYSFKKKSMNA